MIAVPTSAAPPATTPPAPTMPRSPRRYALPILLVAALLPLAAEAQEGYRIAPAGSWIEALRPDLEARAADGAQEGGTEILLLDRQDRVGDVQETYMHVAYRLVDEAAVQSGGQIELSFDPTYQELVLHALSRSRGGETVDVLDASRLEVIQREGRLEYQIYDGSRTLVAFVSDLRVGDVVEYAYTLRGSNPVFGTHYSTSFATEWQSPVDRLRFRVLWPAGRTLSVHDEDTGLEARVRELGAFREYVWDRSDVPALDIDSDLPFWYDPYPRVRLSDFAGWGDVVAWGRGLFDLEQPLPAEVHAFLEGLRASGASVEEQVLASLRYAQDEVRYLGIELGVNSHIPYPPTTVMERRYGDCKDKSLLLITMLRELGLQAYPALVSTYRHEHFADFQPSSDVFDHAIVRVLVDGKWHFVDPTLLHQRGDLNEVRADYGAALVLDEGRGAPTPMVERTGREGSTLVHLAFRLGEVGDTVSLEVRSEYRGPSANRMRSTIRNTSAADLRRNYEQYYAGLYPAIEATADHVVEDDEEANVVKLAEFYSIPDFWLVPEGGRRGEAEFYPMELADLLPSTGTVNRDMPLGLSHPVHMRYSVDAVLDLGWSVSEEADSAVSEAARFTYTSSVRGDTLGIVWEYETFADHVETGAATEHIRAMERARDLLSYSITLGVQNASPLPRGSELNWPILMLAIAVLAIAGFGATRLYGLEPSWPHRPPPPEDVPADALQGIGGWLALLTLGVLLQPFLILGTFITTLESYGLSTWNQLTTPGSVGYHAMWAPTLMFELVGNLVSLVVAATVVVALVRKRRLFPALWIGLAVGQIAFFWADYAMASPLPLGEAPTAEIARTVGQMLGALLWTGYLFRSVRVRNTFVR